MTTQFNTTLVALSASPSPFSLKSFEEVLLHMERTIFFDAEMRHMPHHDAVAVERAGEETADAWVATEEATFSFIRAHSGATAVPLLTETAHNLVSLLDIETEDHPSLPLAQSIRRTIEETLSFERAEIAADAAYVLEQRENMEAEQRAELTRILNANAETDPMSDGPGV